MNYPGWTPDCISVLGSQIPRSQTPVQPGSQSEIGQKHTPSMSVPSKMAGEIFLPAELPSASISALKMDSRLFFDVKLCSMDIPQWKVVSVKFLIDSGAEISTLSYSDFLNYVKPLSKLYPSRIQLHNFDNSCLRKPKGQVSLKISVGRDCVTANFQVVRNSCQSVLGVPELKSLQLLLDMETDQFNQDQLLILVISFHYYISLY